MQLFVLVMQRGSQIKIAQDVLRCLHRLGIAPMGEHVLLQTQQQVQGAFYALVACLEHVKRRLETDTGRPETRDCGRWASGRHGHRPHSTQMDCLSLGIKRDVGSNVSPLDGFHHGLQWLVGIGAGRWRQH